jgi:hypothetical protein
MDTATDLWLSLVGAVCIGLTWLPTLDVRGILLIVGVVCLAWRAARMVKHARHRRRTSAERDISAR